MGRGTKNSARSTGNTQTKPPVKMEKPKSLKQLGKLVESKEGSDTESEFEQEVMEMEGKLKMGEPSNSKRSEHKLNGWMDVIETAGSGNKSWAEKVQEEEGSPGRIGASVWDNFDISKVSVRINVDSNNHRSNYRDL